MDQKGTGMLIRTRRNNTDFVLHLMIKLQNWTRMVQTALYNFQRKQKLIGIFQDKMLAFPPNNTTQWNNVPIIVKNSREKTARNAEFTLGIKTIKTAG